LSVVVAVVVVEVLFPLGELVVEAGMSRLGRDEEVGVTSAWDEFARRGKGAEGSRGEAIVDMAALAG
jgi:hypothetical protein